MRVIRLWEDFLVEKALNKVEKTVQGSNQGDDLYIEFKKLSDESDVLKYYGDQAHSIAHILANGNKALTEIHGKYTNENSQKRLSWKDTIRIWFNNVIPKAESIINESSDEDSVRSIINRVVLASVVDKEWFWQQKDDAAKDVRLPEIINNEFIKIKNDNDTNFGFLAVQLTYEAFWLWVLYALRKKIKSDPPPEPAPPEEPIDDTQQDDPIDDGGGDREKGDGQSGEQFDYSEIFLDKWLKAFQWRYLTQVDSEPFLMFLDRKDKPVQALVPDNQGKKFANLYNAFRKIKDGRGKYSWNSYFNEDNKLIVDNPALYKNDASIIAKIIDADAQIWAPSQSKFSRSDAEDYAEFLAKGVESGDYATALNKLSEQGIIEVIDEKAVTTSEVNNVKDYLKSINATVAKYMKALLLSIIDWCEKNNDSDITCERASNAIQVTTSNGQASAGQVDLVKHINSFLNNNPLIKNNISDISRSFIDLITKTSLKAKSLLSLLETLGWKAKKN